jgi:hypothetical protein
MITMMLEVSLRHDGGNAASQLLVLFVCLWRRSSSQMHPPPALLLVSEALRVLVFRIQLRRSFQRCEEKMGIEVVSD